MGLLNEPAVRAHFYWLAMGHCEMVVQGQCVDLLICFGVQAFLDLQLRFVDICEAKLLRSSRLLGCGVKRPGLYMTGAAVPVLLFGNPGGRLCMEDRYIDTTKSNRARVQSQMSISVSARNLKSIPFPGPRHSGMDRRPVMDYQNILQNKRPTQKG